VWELKEYRMGATRIESKLGIAIQNSKEPREERSTTGRDLGEET
jgi:hypothetical protein